MRSNKEWVLGGLFIGFGILMLLKNFGVTDIGVGNILARFWPLIPILFGIQFLVKPKGRGEIITGLVLIIIGGLVMGEKSGLYELDLSFFWKAFWPVIIIIVGFNFLTGPKTKGKSKMAIMGGLEMKKEGWKLEDGVYWAVMGGIELDLRKAIIEDREYSIACNAIMGGIEVIVPDDITVICQGTAILGGIELLEEGSGGIIASIKAEKYSKKEDNKKIVNIYCRAIMGGIEVKV